MGASQVSDPQFSRFLALTPRPPPTNFFPRPVINDRSLTKGRDIITQIDADSPDDTSMYRSGLVRAHAPHTHHVTNPRDMGCARIERGVKTFSGNNGLVGARIRSFLMVCSFGGEDWIG